MDFYLALSATALFLYTVYCFLKRNIRIDKEPPALWSLPIIGSLPFLSNVDRLHLVLMEKAKKYGNVFSFDAGSSYTLIVNGYDAIREGLVSRAADFSGRGEIFVQKYVWNPECRGIIYRQHDEQFKLNKIFTLTTLKEFGYGTHSIMEAKIQAEIHELIKYVCAKNGVPWYPAKILELSTLNVIHNLLFSERFEPEDKKGEFLIECTHRFSESISPLYDFFPIAVKIPYFRKKLDAYRPTGKQFIQALTEKINECLKRNDSSDNFVKEYASKFKGTYDEVELNFILRDLILAGTETSSGQLGWALVLICNNPDIQSRLHKEIDSVIPSHRLPSLDDKAKLPFLEATILEVMRFRTALPLGGPRLTPCETTLNGYSIRSNTTVIFNVWSAHMDPKIWKDPDVFRPGRFLDASNSVINREQILSFSLGKRACLGELLARQEMFLYLGSLLQHFDVLPPEGQSKVREEMEVIRLLTPAPYELRLVQRMKLERTTL